MEARLKINKRVSITLIQIYALTITAEEGIKEKFYGSSRLCLRAKKQVVHLQFEETNDTLTGKKLTYVTLFRSSSN